MMSKIEDGKRTIIVKKSKYDKSQLIKRQIRLIKQRDI